DLPRKSFARRAPNRETGLAVPPPARGTQVAPADHMEKAARAAGAPAAPTPRAFRRRWGRERGAQGFTPAADGVDVGRGVLLAVSAGAMSVGLAVSFVRGLFASALVVSVVGLLDQVLLTLMLVELLYTVQVSFREHVLVPEPFILVALIAGVRRILVLTPELSKLLEQGEAQFRNAMIELVILTVMTLSLVWCLVLLRKRHPEAV